VAIYRGVQQNIGPIVLSSVYQESQIQLADLPAYQREAVIATINADDLRDAHDILDRLQTAAGEQ
jgi:protein phosphatase